VSTETTAKTKKTAPAKTEEPVEPEVQTTVEPEAKPVPKSKLSWRERLAQMDPDEAAKVRAKAAEASRRSKAKKRLAQTGTVIESSIAKLEAKLQKNLELEGILVAERTDIEARLQELKAEADAKAQIDQAVTEATGEEVIDA
jgi:hypothetical protein